LWWLFFGRIAFLRSVLLRFSVAILGFLIRFFASFFKIYLRFPSKASLSDRWRRQVLSRFLPPFLPLFLSLPNPLNMAGGWVLISFSVNY
jgi:hypothetical protein